MRVWAASSRPCSLPWPPACSPAASFPTRALLIQRRKRSPLASAFVTSLRTKLIGTCRAGLVERSVVLDQLLRNFLTHHPAAQVLSLGSGLSTQFKQLDNGRLHWVDVDLPEVVELRRALFPPHPRRCLVSASVTEAGWISILGDLRGPTFAVTEGTLDVSRREQVFQLAQDLAEVQRGGPAEFAYDYHCSQMIGQAWLNPSLRRLGAKVQMGFGVPGGAFARRAALACDRHLPGDGAAGLVLRSCSGRGFACSRAFGPMASRTCGSWTVPTGMRVERLKEDRGNRDADSRLVAWMSKFGNRNWLT